MWSEYLQYRSTPQSVSALCVQCLSSIYGPLYTVQCEATLLQSDVEVTARPLTNGTLHPQLELPPLSQLLPAFVHALC